jgi:hypothetical protein
MRRDIVAKKTKKSTQTKKPSKLKSGLKAGPLAPPHQGLSVSDKAIILDLG